MAKAKGHVIEEWATRALGVGIVCENEILRFGLKAALDGLLTVRDIHEIPSCSPSPVGRNGRSLDVVIVSYAEWDTALRCVPAARAAGVRVLAVIDDAVAGRPERLALLRPDGFILQRDLTAAALEDALLRISRSETVVPPEILSGVFDSVADATRRAHLRAVEFTAREQEALELLAEGLSNKEIARRLSISVHGVKRLVGNILLKLNAPNRTQAAVLAMRGGLVRKRV